MEDLAREIMSNLKRKDRKSHLRLVANIPGEVLEVKAPIENGSVIFKVTQNSLPDIEYRQEDFESLVSFIDFFCKDDSNCWLLTLKSCDEETYMYKCLMTDKIDHKTKIRHIEGAVRMLLTK